MIDAATRTFLEAFFKKTAAKQDVQIAASRQPDNVLGLRWAPEYSSTSVGPRQLDIVRQYLRDQPKHHPDEAI
ncbi:MAG: hypothetical protein DMD48_01645 [Gemmatimonadetes bacterium]|nr:MAG: hypothetical protein DMD48_01645 [Gemmatimonadota bacterium]